VRESLLGSANQADELASLRGRRINYDPARAPEDGRVRGHWHVDSGEVVIGQEPRGAPVRGGAWETGCVLVRQYEFAEPRILRAAYRAGSELDGRDMLLEGRFYGLRFYFGVRVTRVIDEIRDGDDGAERVWGWSYQTLEGHLEQGRLSYEVIKNLATGRVTFRVCGYSRMAPIPSPVVRLGFMVFGRWTQRRFYEAAMRRMRDLVRAAQGGAAPPAPTVRADGIALAPAGAISNPVERLARAWRHPGV
jgi:uncharacterized protein (UPF0548 family)